MRTYEPPPIATDKDLASVLRASRPEGFIRRPKSGYRPPRRPRGHEITESIRDLVERYERLAASERTWARFAELALEAKVNATDSRVRKILIRDCVSWRDHLEPVTAALYPDAGVPTSEALQKAWATYKNADDVMKENMAPLQEELMAPESADPASCVIRFDTVHRSCSEALKASMAVRKAIHSEIRFLVDELDALLLRSEELQP